MSEKFWTMSVLCVSVAAINIVAYVYVGPFGVVVTLLSVLIFTVVGDQINQ